MRKSVKEYPLSSEDKVCSDKLLFSRFLALPEVLHAPSLFLFYGVGREPETPLLFAPLLRQGKCLGLPRCLPQGRMEFRQYRGPRSLRPGPYGIPEPDDSCPALPPASLLLVPSLCCDRRGFRLGHGGGYYDRYLSHFSGFTVALCRDVLLQDRLPAQPHDLPVDLILTETQRLSFSWAEKSGALAPPLM